MTTVMIVDDKEMMRDSVAATLRRAGFQTRVYASASEALTSAARSRPDAVVTDLKMPGMTGLELLEKLRAIDMDLPVVLMTAFGDIETAVKAIKLGAFDYITKPFEGDELVIAVKRAIRCVSAERENEVLRRDRAVEQSASHCGMDRLIGDSPAMRRVKEQVRAVADSHGTVLIVGESGSGKEVVARAIHEMSSRSASPFLAVNCAALNESLLESELFGHEKGAFTGADKLRKGRFELAHTGTLLLDEISEIAPTIQAKLLRVLQERALERVGSSATIGVDVRVVATSNRDLPRAVASGHFRQDLFFRLNVLPIHLPPLRDRPEDIPRLASHFAASSSAREGRPPIGFTPEAFARMQMYSWPGNVRELQNICERAVVLCRASAAGDFITTDLIEPWLNQGEAGSLHGEGAPQQQGGVFRQHSGERLHIPMSAPVEVEAPRAGAGVRPLEEIEREAIISTLRRFNGHRSKTARALGIGVRTLGLKLKKWKELELIEHSL